MRIEPAQIDFPMLRSQHDFEAGQLPSMLVPARDATFRHGISSLSSRFGTARCRRC